MKLHASQTRPDIFSRQILPVKPSFLLEQPCDLTGIRVNINTTEGRIGACARHQADGTCTGAQELGT